MIVFTVVRFGVATFLVCIVFCILEEAGALGFDVIVSLKLVRFMLLVDFVVETTVWNIRQIKFINWTYKLHKHVFSFILLFFNWKWIEIRNSYVRKLYISHVCAPISECIGKKELPEKCGSIIYKHYNRKRISGPRIKN